MAKITFGKFQGWDTEKLAQTSEGRGYLEWGAEDLRSPKWRKEFQRVLDDFSAADIDIMAEAKAILVNSPEIGWDEAETVAEMIKEEAEQSEAVADAFEKAEDQLRAEMSRTYSDTKSVDQLIRLIKSGDYQSWIDQGKIKFSSSKNQKIVTTAVKAFEAEIDGLEIW